MIFNVTGGGGGGGLNLKVVGGTTQPANPRENTVWINTTTAITGYALGPTPPENGTDGLVWLKTADTGVEINVGRKNAVLLHLADGKLYTGGAWTSMEGWVYVNSAWTQFAREIIVLYKNGVEETELSGGLSTFVGSSSVASVKKNATNIVTMASYRSSNNTSAFVYPKNKIDFTNLSTVTVNSDWITSRTEGAALIYLASKIANNQDVTETFAVAKNANTLDVSKISGEYYLCVGCKSYGTSGAKVVCTIKEITLQ